jgi:hypothetical protein
MLFANLGAFYPRYTSMAGYASLARRLLPNPGGETVVATLAENSLRRGMKRSKHIPAEITT